MTDSDYNEKREEIFSKAVRAGKRTYFFDVKATRANDYYLTITESKKRFNQGDEKAFYEKHKIFLYKEDFDKFTEGLTEAISHIKIAKGSDPVQDNNSSETNDNTGNSGSSPYTDVNFNDLES